jgi:hypothetical protein
MEIELSPNSHAMVSSRELCVTGLQAEISLLSKPTAPHARAIETHSNLFQCYFTITACRTPYIGSLTHSVPHTPHRLSYRHVATHPPFHIAPTEARTWGKTPSP